MSFHLFVVVFFRMTERGEGRGEERKERWCTVLTFLLTKLRLWAFTESTCKCLSSFDSESCLQQLTKFLALVVHTILIRKYNFSEDENFSKSIQNHLTLSYRFNMERQLLVGSGVVTLMFSSIKIYILQHKHTH